jgi:hypothetical protein
LNTEGAAVGGGVLGPDEELHEDMEVTGNTELTFKTRLLFMPSW